MDESEYGRTQYFCVCHHLNIDHLIESDGLYHCTLCLCTKLEACEE